MTVRVLRAATWLTVLLILATGLRAAGAGALAAPPLTSLDGLLAWVGGREPVTTALALARLVAECGTWYLLALSVLRAGASLTTSDALSRCGDRIALPAARRVVRAGLGLGVSAAAALPITGPGGLPQAALAAEAPPGSAAMQPVPLRADADPPAGTAVMRPDALEATVPVERQVPTAPLTWTVSPGESFWSIADDVVSTARGHHPSDAEIARYWRDLIDRNRHRLVDPSDPDLILPGQVFELPSLSPVTE